MPIREFTDSKGMDWCVWDVTPTHMHPATRGEDFMGNLQDGWLAFESEQEKRRLEAPYPANWMTLPLPRLEELLRRAAPVLKRKSSPSGKHKAITDAEDESGALAASGARRTFVSPGGREWTVRVHECLDRDGEHQVVLRFTADDIVVELTRWPHHWEDSSVAEFAMMLLDANPPRRLPKGRGPQRRREDRAE